MGKNQNTRTDQYGCEHSLADYRGQVVFLNFWATWCPPCRALGPIVAEVAEELDGKIRVGKVNIDEEPALAARFGIASIPTLLVFKYGQITGQSIGLQGKPQIIDLLAL